MSLTSLIRTGEDELSAIENAANIECCQWPRSQARSSTTHPGTNRIEQSTESAGALIIRGTAPTPGASSFTDFEREVLDTRRSIDLARRRCGSIVSQFIDDHLKNGGLAIIATHQELNLSAPRVQRIELSK